MKTKCKRFQFMVISVVVFVFLAVPFFLISQPREESILNDELAGKRTRIKNLFSDISTVNLLNGLYLTQEQMKEILNLANKAIGLKEEFIEQKSAVYMRTLNEAETAYTQLFQDIMKGSPAKEGGEVENRARRIEHRLKEMTDQVFRTMSNELSHLDNELSEILTPEQQQVIAGFKPCLIPPKDLKNPVRAGQASSNDRAIKMLRRIREIPDYAWERRKYEFLSRHVERFSKHRSVMTEKEKEKELQRLLYLTEKIRSLSDTNFELEKDNLAEELRPTDHIHELREELEQRIPHMRKAKVSKQARFLLNERIIPILEERMNAQ